MTGMPAFGPTHDEKALWGLVAIVQEMPRMTPEQYRQKTDAKGAQGVAGHDHAHGKDEAGPEQGQGDSDHSQKE